jgi:pyridoxamine 5'-phosphate oxidase
MPSPEFVLSTLHPAPPGSPTPYVPRARYCIYRGLWASLPENSHNDATRNPNCYDSDLPIFTTDARMQKVSELFASSAGKAGEEEQTRGSGGGGPVEAVWWVNVQTREPERKIMSQWRVRGTAWVIGPDIESSDPAQQSSGVRTVKSEIGKRMRVLDADKTGDWSWEREVRTLFGNQSPGIRGSFRGPPPGQSVNTPFDEEKLALGKKVESLDDEVARENFRVVVIRPDFVEQVDLRDAKTARRYVYTYDERSGDWKCEEQWP